MIDIAHTLAAHLEIGEPIVTATIEHDRFSTNALSGFFQDLRDGHRAVLGEYSSSLANTIGGLEHQELDNYGIFGKFAGRLAIKESGLAVIEQELHHAAYPDIQSLLRDSLASAVNTLRSS